MKETAKVQLTISDQLFPITELTLLQTHKLIQIVLAIVDGLPEARNRILSLAGDAALTEGTEASKKATLETGVQGILAIPQVIDIAYEPLMKFLASVLGIKAEEAAGLKLVTDLRKIWEAIKETNDLSAVLDALKNVLARPGVLATKTGQTS